MPPTSSAWPCRSPPTSWRRRSPSSIATDGAMNPTAFALAYALLFCGALVSVGRVMWGDGFSVGAPETLALLFLGAVLATLDAIVVGILGAAMRRQAATAGGMADDSDPIVQRFGRGADGGAGMAAGAV